MAEPVKGRTLTDVEWFDHPMFLPDGTGDERCVRCGRTADDLTYGQGSDSCLSPASGGTE